MKLKLSLFAGLALVAACAWYRPASAAVPQTQTILKSYFVSNAVPTEAQYAELIDTLFWYVNQTYSNAVWSAQSSQASLDTLTNATRAAFITPADGNPTHWDSSTPLQLLSGANVAAVYPTNTTVYASSFLVLLTQPPNGTNDVTVFLSVLPSGVFVPPFTNQVISTSSNWFVYRVGNPNSSLFGSKKLAFMVQ